MSTKITYNTKITCLSIFAFLFKVRQLFNEIVQIFQNSHQLVR
jgi:hypothetical protein